MRAGFIRVGVISDTHGLLRPEAVTALRGVDHILHAGDIGNMQILDTVRALAPVTAIRGNIDRIGPCAKLPAAEFIELGGHALYMLHDLATLDLNPSDAGIAAVISGHSHKPAIEIRKSVLYFNPGSAGPRRFTLPVSIGILEIGATGITPQLIELSVN